MKHAAFHGVFPYLVSPVMTNGAINRPVLSRLVNDLIDAGVHGLAPLGSTGEFAYLNAEQRQEVVACVIEAARGRVPVVPGVAATTLVEAEAQTRRYTDLGADGILAILEAYFPLSDDGVVSYFEHVAKSTHLPLVLYTNPNFQRSDLSLASLKRLSRLPNVCYLKDASSNTGRLLTIMNEVGDDLRLFSASAHIPACVMLLGGLGWMAGPACVVPRQSVRLYELCKAQRWDEAMDLQRSLWGMNRVFAKYNLAACIKGSLTMQGYDVGPPIAPQTPLDEAAKADIRQTLAQLKALPSMD